MLGLFVLHSQIKATSKDGPVNETVSPFTIRAGSVELEPKYMFTHVWTVADLEAAIKKLTTHAKTNKLHLSGALTLGKRLKETEVSYENWAVKSDGSIKKDEVDVKVSSASKEKKERPKPKKAAEMVEIVRSFYAKNKRLPNKGEEFEGAKIGNFVDRLMTNREACVKLMKDLGIEK